MSSLISSWTLFPQVLARACQRNLNGTIGKTRVRKTISNGEAYLSSKKRQVGNNRTTIDLTDEISFTVLDAPDSIIDTENWFHARQMRDYLGSISALQACGYSNDSGVIPVSTRVGKKIITILIADEILAMKDDGPHDLAWSELPNSKYSTLFSYLVHARELNQVVIQTSIHHNETDVFLQFDFYLHSSLFSSNLSIPGSIRADMQDLVHFVFPPSVPTNAFTQSAIVDLYTHLKPTCTAEPPAGIQPEELLPQLLPFQRRTVSWLLSRESASVSESGKVVCKSPSEMDRLPFSWEQVQTPSGQELFINRLSGTIYKTSKDIVASEPEPRGGILAEEMGLGKTVEMLALILLHRRKVNSVVAAASADYSGGGSLIEDMSVIHLDEGDQSVPGSEFPSTIVDYDPPMGLNLIASASTLIITPPSILHQWASEIENHAPGLKVYIYLEEQDKSIGAEELATYDVVLTTYPVLSKEINYAQEYDRPRRYERQYIPRQSPFVKIHWWRVCLDEAQMIEGTTVSQAAAMTLMIPRVMSWAISGTPIRRHIEDLHSLLRFLNQEPIASSKKLWKLLTCFSFRSTFISSYQRIMHRHAKKDVARELTIPKQKRLIYSIDFSDIERNFYMDIWDECVSECDLNSLNKKGGNINLEKLQAWLVRLRQTCCHPQISTWSKESLGRKDVRTIDTVLNVMVQKTSSLLGAKEKALISTKIRRAVLSAHLDNGFEVLKLFEEIEEQVRGYVQFWKALAEKELADKTSANSKGKDKAEPSYLDTSNAISSSAELVESKQRNKRDGWVSPSSRFRDWQEQLHRILFYMAANYGQFGMNDKETQYYSLAASVREEMLAAPERQFNASLDIVMRGVHGVTLEKLKAVPTPTPKSGASLAKLMCQFKVLVEFLNKQRVIVNEWRSYLVESLIKPLSDAVDDDFLNSVEVQNSVESYLHNYGRMVYLRKDILIGAQATINNYVRKAKDAKNHARMVEEREKRTKRLAGASYVQEEENLDQTLEMEIYKLLNDEIAYSVKNVGVMIDSIANGKNIPAEERAQAAAESQDIKSLLDQQVAQVEFFEKELESLRTLASTRAQYFHHLQGISDKVISIDSKNPQADVSRCLNEEIALKSEIAKLKSKLKYLEHIEETITASISSNDRDGEESDAEERLCLICSDTYRYGLLTECGHVFCEACLLEWTKTHSKCPSCKGHISKSRLKPVSMTRSDKDKRANDELVQDTERISLADFHSALSSDTIQPVPERIQKVKIQTGYGSKIDSIVRHIQFLIQEDPAVKCLVFSQWSNLLHLLTESLTINQIGHIRLDGASNKSAVQEFKTNRDKHVFMLHAKSQSAGLTLLQATHVFICEPLVNPALQAQAVSRVHRIGQTNKTFVHYYLLKDTVEVPCFELFERNSAISTGSNKLGSSKINRGLDSAKSRMIAGKKPAMVDLDKNSIEIFGLEQDQATELDLNTVTTANESAESQRNNGEQMEEADLKFCFVSQKKMIESLAAINVERALTISTDKGKAIALNEDVQMTEPSSDHIEDFMMDGYEGQVIFEEDGTMSFY
ncbi:hypothetical protein BGZ49_001740 [Haplosporangium sp. Z 27]|nr:hypothetical protein BGZ49_001740 [Haplosporangium sp. Z 27]